MLREATNLIILMSIVGVVLFLHWYSYVTIITFLDRISIEALPGSILVILLLIALTKLDILLYSLIKGYLKETK